MTFRNERFQTLRLFFEIPCNFVWKNTSVKTLRKKLDIYSSREYLWRTEVMSLFDLSKGGISLVVKICKLIAWKRILFKLGSHGKSYTVKKKYNLFFPMHDVVSLRPTTCIHFRKYLTALMFSGLECIWR